MLDLVCNGLITETDALNTHFGGLEIMRIEKSPQVRQGYRKSAAFSESSKTFGQVMQTKAQDRYVSSTNVQLFNTEANFSSAELAYGNPAVSNATYAKLNQLAEITGQMDYTDMSSEEIYAEIWNRYNEAFDGNMVAITACITGPVEWARINNHFQHEIDRHIFIPEVNARRAAGKESATTDARKASLQISSQEGAGKVLRDSLLKVLGYDGMSFDEMEAAIKEKYAGKNSTLDFLKMQSELKRTGVLEHKMGDQARMYCDLIQTQLEYAFNPNYRQKGGPAAVNLHISTDQWYRVANQPFDTGKLAVGMKEQLGEISSINGYTPDIIKIMEDCIDQFVKKVVSNSFEELIGETKK